MTKMKKLFAVVLAIAMLFTMSSIAASAETAPTVSITANDTTLGVGESLELTVNVENAGAVDLTLSYDANAFEYVTATFTNTAVNKKADSIKVGDGSVRIFLLDSDATLTFKAKTAGTATFTATAAASNEDGTKKYDVDVNATNVEVTEAGHIEILGATTRDTDDIALQDLGFIGQLYVPDGATVAEFGIIAAFTNELKNYNEEFTLDSKDDLNEEENIVVSKAVTDADLIAEVVNNGGKFISHVKNTGTYDLMGKNITARLYVKFADSNEVIYSNNINVVNGVVTAEDGLVKNSVVKVLGAQINAICNAPDATEAMATEAAQVVANYNAAKTAENKQALLEFVENYETYLTANNG